MGTLKFISYKTQNRQKSCKKWRWLHKTYGSGFMEKIFYLLLGATMCALKKDSRITSWLLISISGIEFPKFFFKSWISAHDVQPLQEPKYNCWWLHFSVPLCFFKQNIFLHQMFMSSTILFRSTILHLFPSKFFSFKTSVSHLHDYMAYTKYIA